MCYNLAEVSKMLIYLYYENILICSTTIECGLSPATSFSQLIRLRILNSITAFLLFNYIILFLEKVFMLKTIKLAPAVGLLE